MCKNPQLSKTTLHPSSMDLKVMESVDKGDLYFPDAEEEGMAKGSWLWWIPGLVHYSVCVAPVVVFAAMYFYFGLLPTAICVVGSVYRVYRVILNNSVGDTGSEFGCWTIKTGREVAVKKRVAVIGAGPSGLVTTKELRAEGHDVSCYDMDKVVGGVFEHKFWPGGCLTSSPYVTAFSDFEPPRDMDGKEHWNHYTKEGYVEYLKAYANNYGLYDSLKMGKSVLHVAKRESEESSAEEKKYVYYLQVQDVDDGTVVEEGPFDHLAICTGLNENPRIDTRTPGFESFTGTVVHTSQFASTKSIDDAFKVCSGKRIMTIGLGESMADILGIMSDKMTTPPTKIVASVRSGAFIIPRINKLTGLNNDFDTTRIRYSLPKVVHNASFVLCSYLSFMFPKRYSDEAKIRFQLFRQIRGMGPAMKIATKSGKFINAAIEGRVEFKKGIKKIEGSTVYLEDGTYENVEVIVFGAGYDVSKFAFIDDDTFKPTGQSLTCKCPSRRFLRMFDPNLGSDMAFIGFGRPLIGTIPTVSDLQARLFAQIVSEKRVVPTEKVMRKKAESDREKQRKKFQPWNPNWGGLIDWIPYMDSIAQEVGCRPKRSWMMTRPGLALKLVAGPMTAFHYRLNGPGAKPEMAEEVIRRIPYSGRGVDSLWFFMLHLSESILKWPFTVVYDFIVYPLIATMLLLTSPCRRSSMSKSGKMSGMKQKVM